MIHNGDNQKWQELKFQKNLIGTHSVLRDPRFLRIKGISMDNRKTFSTFCFSKIERTGVIANKSGQRTSVVHGYTFYMPKSGILKLNEFYSFEILLLTFLILRSSSKFGFEFFFKIANHETMVWSCAST